MATRTSSQIYDAIGDTCGFYDTFTTAQAIEWNSVFHAQRIRDVLRQMVKNGTLQRVQRGAYTWSFK